MPIYAYRCGSCGHAKDVLQKLSDAPLTTCPACGAAAFTKQLTAAGFQLKGTGWYATDFRGNGNGAKAPAGEGGGGGGSKPGEKPSETKSSDSVAAKSEPPAASAGGCGSACGCH